jgi:hypothetical protein
MRSDMAKVIVERPRLAGHAWNKPKGYRRRLRRLLDDGPPVREGIKVPWQGHTKELNEHLGPLRRFLDSQVGRPWDKVFAEICAHINRSSAVQDHVRDHVEDYVAVHVLLIDGVPCSGAGDWNYGRPLHQLLWKQWYVCPRTGLLRRNQAPRNLRRAEQRKESPPRFIPVSDTLQCRFLDNAWHLVTLKPLPPLGGPRQRCREWDVLLARPAAEITVAEARKHYGSAVYAVAKRQLARRELRQFPIPVEFWK